MRELLIPIVQMIIGIGFTYTGYKIAIQKKFDLMVTYFKDRRMYVNHRAFAMRHGMIELIGGGLMLFTSFVSAYFKLTRPAFLIAFLGSMVILILLKFNKVFSKKNW